MRNVGGGITVNWIELNFENKRSYSGFRQREQQEAQHAMDLDFEFSECGGTFKQIPLE